MTPPFESGGGGLVSTVDDYYAFCRMMLNKGRHGTARILSRASVELMTTDQLWAGGVGTSAYADPHERLIGILMTQRHLDSPAGANVHRDFWTTTYQAITD